MKIASFNVNSVRVRLETVLKWIKTEKADVLCVQETKVRDEEFPIDAFTDAGLNVAFRGEKSYNGVAIISPHEIKNVSFGFNGKEDEATRLVRAKILGVNIVNTYIPQGFEVGHEKFKYKLNWYKKLGKYFKDNFTPRQKLIWLGDFNVAPTDKDVYAPKKLYGEVGFHPDEHKALQKVKDFGFEDIFRKHCTDGGEFTFWNYRAKDPFKNNSGWRVDHIFATKSVANKSVNSWIDKKIRITERPSDHAPIVAEFKL